MTGAHTPVLADEVIQALAVKKGGKYIDATFGQGGHTALILRAGGDVLAIDRDAEQIEKGRVQFTGEPLLRLRCGNFAAIAQIAQEELFTPADGILFDLGLSYGQLSLGGKGLSFKAEQEQLDMRLDKDVQVSAADLLNTLTVASLRDLFERNAEVLNATELAETIVRSRPLRTVKDLNKVLSRVGMRGSVVLQVYQALRIEVNREFDAIRTGLAGASTVIKPGCPIAVISFHSLEDRLVKQFIRTNRLITLGDSVTAGNRDLRFERSAKLRVFTTR